jgi:hypothetical protein
MRGSGTRKGQILSLMRPLPRLVFAYGLPDLGQLLFDLKLFLLEFGDLDRIGWEMLLLFSDCMFKVTMTVPKGLEVSRRCIH